MHPIKTEPKANLHQFYQMEIVGVLFGDWGLVGNGGRIGSPKQAQIEWFGSEVEAIHARFDL